MEANAGELQESYKTGLGMDGLANCAPPALGKENSPNPSLGSPSKKRGSGKKSQAKKQSRKSHQGDVRPLRAINISAVSPGMSSSSCNDAVDPAVTGGQESLPDHGTNVSLCPLRLRLAPRQDEVRY
jgi:hypothetical protein